MAQGICALKGQGQVTGPTWEPRLESEPQAAQGRGVGRGVLFAQKTGEQGLGRQTQHTCLNHHCFLQGFLSGFGG